MALSGIYAIECEKGFLYYGSSSNIKRRFNQHKTELKSGKHCNPVLQNTYNKYGIKHFSFYVVEVVLDQSKLIEREQYWIDFLATTESFHYNMCLKAGSVLGRVMTDKEKENLRIKHKGKKLSTEHKKLLSASHTGKTLKPSHKENIRRGLVGRKRAIGDGDSIALGRSGGKVYTFKNNETGVVYYNITNIRKFAITHNLPVSSFYSLVKGRMKKVGAFCLVSVHILNAN